MYDSTALDAASGFIVHIEMKNLVLVVPPGAAAIAQRMVSRWAPSVPRGVTPPQHRHRLCRIAACAWHTQDTLARAHSMPRTANLCVSADAGAGSCAVHAGTLSSNSSAGRGQSGRRSLCQQRQQPGGSTPAQLCWRSAGSGGRQAACARRWRGGGTTCRCIAPSTAAARATCVAPASASRSPACHVSAVACLVTRGGVVCIAKERAPLAAVILAAGVLQ